MFSCSVLVVVGKVIGKHSWGKAGMCGDRWKDEDQVMLLMHTPVFTISLASA